MAFRICSILFCLAVAPVLMGFPAEAQPIDLDPLIEEALRENPSLRVLEERISAFEARVPQAGALADPVFRLEASNLPISRFDYDSTPMSGNQLVLSQMLPFPGTLSARERAAKADLKGVKDTLEDRKVSIVRMVKEAYFDLAFFDRAIDVTRDHEALLRDFVKIAQTKYSVGSGLQQDVLKAQVALSSLQERLIGLETRRHVTEARLNLVLNRPPDRPVGHPQDPAMTAVTMTPKDLQTTALETRPLLQSISADVTAWSAREEAASRQLWPNFTLSLGYRQRAVVPGDPVAGEDFLSFGAGLNIPIYRGRKQKQQVLEARARAREAGARLENVGQQIMFDIRRLWLVRDQHARKAELFRTTIVPQAEMSLSSARSGYEADKVDFLTLLNNQASLLAFRIRSDFHIVEHEKTLAELEAVVGRRLFNTN